MGEIICTAKLCLYVNEIETNCARANRRIPVSPKDVSPASALLMKSLVSFQLQEIHYAGDSPTYDILAKIGLIQTSSV